MKVVVNVKNNKFAGQHERISSEFVWNFSTQKICVGVKFQMLSPSTHLECIVSQFVSTKHSASYCLLILWRAA
jgi:hypothetical protein